MTDEVEVVARAICKAMGESPGQCRFQSCGMRTDGTAFYECHERKWHRYAPAAIAAISAMEQIAPEAATSGELQALPPLRAGA
jgi:hypothetical protein